MMNVICKVCGSNEYTNEGGFFFCKECNTQSQEFREEVYDTEERGVGQRLNTTKVVKPPGSSAKESDIKWTTWEGYNFILIGLVNELIELGAPPDIKFTSLQLWAAYLRKLEVAFTSTTTVELPKLSLLYKETDVETVYKRTRVKRRRKLSGSKTSIDEAETSGDAQSKNNLSIRDKIATSRQKAKEKRALIRAEYEAEIQSETESTRFTPYSSSESTASSVSVQSIPLSFSETAKEFFLKKISSHHFKEHCEIPDLLCHRMTGSFLGNKSKPYSTSPYHLSKYKLYAILYMALLLNKSDIQLSDMIRFIREGHLSYIHIKHFFPEELAMNHRYMKNFEQNSKQGFKQSFFRCQVRDLAKFIGVETWPVPDMYKLCARYVNELQLPEEVLEMILQILDSVDPIKMPINCKTVPNYEARAMSLILFSLKLTFGLDDVTEDHLSFLSTKLNKMLPIKSFNWNDWMQFIEWRKLIISEYHYPTRHLLYPNHMDGSSHLLTNFWNKQTSKYDYLSETQHNTHIFTFQNFFKKLNIYSDSKLTEIIDFPHSLTPYFSYLETILNTINCEIPELFLQNWSQLSITYALKPKRFIKTYKLSDAEILNSRKLQNVVKVKPKEYMIKPLDEKPIKIGTVKDCAVKQNDQSPKCKNIEAVERQRRLCNEKLVFLKASKYYWLNFAKSIGFKECSKEVFEQVENEFPKNFRWVFNTCCELIETEPRCAYLELLIVEGYLRSKNEFMDIEYEDISVHEVMAELGEKYW